MAIAVMLEEEGSLEIPLVQSLGAFRERAMSDEFPERGRIDARGHDLIFQIPRMAAR